MKVFKLYFYIMLIASMFVGCSEDDDERNDNYIPSEVETDLEEPELDRYLTTTDLDGFSIRARFDNGGDKTENMSCTVYWKAYSSKPSKTPSASELTRVESMRAYASTKTSTTFDKSHAGYGGGTYIYYYMKCQNSRFSCTTPVKYTVITR